MADLLSNGRRKGSDMWVWRDDQALGMRGSGASGGTRTLTGATPGWRLDASGTWTWDDPSPLERAGVGVGALRYGFAAEAPAPEPALVPAARGASVPPEEPIFRALSADRHRRATLRAVPDGGHDTAVPERYTAPSIPEPHPGSGPLPIQDASGPVRRGLAEVPTVPPPPAPGDHGDAGGHGGAAVAESPEDELRRRAARRRRPMDEPETVGGRHAMHESRPAGGRHALR